MIVSKSVSANLKCLQTTVLYQSVCYSASVAINRASRLVANASPHCSKVTNHFTVKSIGRVDAGVAKEEFPNAIQNTISGTIPSLLILDAHLKRRIVVGAVVVVLILIDPVHLVRSTKIIVHKVVQRHNSAEIAVKVLRRTRYGNLSA